MFAQSPSRTKEHNVFWGSLLLCLVLLAAQTLGQLHGMAHWGGHGTPQSDKLLADPRPADYARNPEAAHETEVHRQTSACVSGTWLTGLFAGHDEASSACVAFDQLGHFDALVSLPLALPMSLTALQLNASMGLAVARWHAQFQARGPPFPH